MLFNMNPRLIQITLWSMLSSASLLERISCNSGQEVHILLLQTFGFCHFAVSSSPEGFEIILWVRLREQKWCVQKKAILYHKGDAWCERPGWKDWPPIYASCPKWQPTSVCVDEATPVSRSQESLAMVKTVCPGRNMLAFSLRILRVFSNIDKI